jgi:probable HAF family extracellular repeat protein
MRNLGTLSGDTDSYAQAINNSGQVAGVSYSAVSSVLHAFLWTLAGGMQDLGTLGGSSSFAYGINDYGEVVGASDLPGDSTFHAFLWTPSAGMQDLGTLGGPDSTAVAINKYGEIVGWSYLPDNRSIAFLWTRSGGMHSLGTLGGTTSTAYALNSSGQIFGWANTASNTQEAFSWTPSHGMRSLGAGSNSVALGVNTSDEVVGYDSEFAFLWTPALHEQYLNYLLPPNSGWDLSEATAINQSGQIAANGIISQENRAALLTPAN